MNHPPSRLPFAFAMSAAALMSVAGAARAQQNPSQAQMMRMMQQQQQYGGGRNMYRQRWGETFDWDSDDFDEQMNGYSNQWGGGMRGRESEPQTEATTKLGLKIKELQLDRDPTAVLAARTKLAAEARDALLNPPKGEETPAAPGEEPAEGGAPAEVPAAGDDEGAGAEGADAVPMANIADFFGDGAHDPTPEELAAMGGPEAIARMMRGGGPPSKEEAALEKKAQRFQLLATAGDWSAVAAFIAAEGGKDTTAIYNIMLAALVTGDSALLPGEVITISDVSPGDLTDWQITKLGAMLKAAQGRGCEMGPLGVEISGGTRHFGGQDPVKRGRAASLLVAAGLPVQAQAYLPPLEEARSAGNAELLNLYIAYYRARAKELEGQERQDAIAQAWRVCCDVFAIPGATTEQRKKTLKAGLALLREVPVEDGDAWLVSLFKESPDAAWGAIDAINKRASMMLQMQAPAEKRLETLMVIHRLGEAALVSPDPAVWKSGLNMLSFALLQEAEATEKQGGDDQSPFIPADQLAPVLPDARWLTAIDPGLGARLETIAAATDGGAGDIQGVVEMIRPIAVTDHERALKLTESLLKAWVSYVKPGSGEDDEYASMRRYYARMGGYNPYGYGYGGSQQVDGAIPLTRARQQRNLDQLGQIVQELTSLGIDPLPVGPLVDAFAASYSDAEVFTEPEIERVVGPVDGLKHEVVLKLAQTMRQRLAGMWRSPKVQQEAGTRRTDKELAAETLRGYTLALRLADVASAGKPDDWASAMLVADLHFDHAEFLYGQNADLATYASERDEAFGGYRKAAGLYAAAYSSGKAQPSAKVFVQWFSSALGASELGYLTRQDEPDMGQVDAVKAALEALPGDGIAAKHIGLFAKSVTAAMQELNPELKPRFVRQACRVIGDHPDGRDVRKHLAFYDDLLSEVQLQLTVDGSTDVGHTEAFGANLAIWCTRAVSRESGTFSKYLSNGVYHPMTGQPVDYRDDLEKKIRETLAEHFDVVAVQFHEPSVQSLGIGREGWEQQPIAYLLLKVKDASVDRVPPIQMDLDFMDGQGTVILPMTSPVVLINATPDQSPARAAAGLKIEETLDPRGAPKEPVRLEVRAEGKGLMPPLDQLVTLAAPAGLRVAKTDDHGLNILRLETEGDSVFPVTERSWTVEFAPGQGKATAFAFPVSRVEGATVERKQYSDADIVAAEATVALPVGISGARPWLWVIGPVVAGGIATAWVVAVARRRKAAGSKQEAPVFAMPTNVTPVTALSLLRRIEAANGQVLRPEEQRDLAVAIEEVEHRYFARAKGDTASVGPDGLRDVLHTWVTRASRT